MFCHSFFAYRLPCLRCVLQSPRDDRRVDGSGKYTNNGWLIYTDGSHWRLGSRIGCQIVTPDIEIIKKVV